jgi:rRNA-processing protein FCF1
MRKIVLLLALIFFSLPLITRAENPSLILLIDNSGSMKNRLSQEAIIKRVFEEKIINTLKEEEKIGLITFAEKAEVLYPLQACLIKERDKLSSLFERIDFSGRYTDFASGLKAALSELNKADKKSYKAVILISDGKVDPMPIPKRETIPAILKEIEEIILPSYLSSPATIYSIATEDNQLMRELSNRTGGEYFIASNDASLKEAVLLVSQRLAILRMEREIAKVLAKETGTIKETIRGSLQRLFIFVISVSFLFLILLLIILLKALQTSRTLKQLEVSKPVIPIPEGINKEIATLKEDITDKSNLLSKKDKAIAERTTFLEQLSNKGKLEKEQAIDDERINLFNSISSFFVQIPTLKDMVEKNPDISAKDIIGFFSPLQQGVEGLGFVPIGRIGEGVIYNSEEHQPAGTEGFKEGESVKIKYIGYRYKGKVLKKAMVGRV